MVWWLKIERFEEMTTVKNQFYGYCSMLFKAIRASASNLHTLRLNHNPYLKHKHNIIQVLMLLLSLPIHIYTLIWDNSCVVSWLHFTLTSFTHSFALGWLTFHIGNIHMRVEEREKKKNQVEFNSFEMSIDDDDNILALKVAKTNFQLGKSKVVRKFIIKEFKATSKTRQVHLN
jgi:hypothetical protein